MSYKQRAGSGRNRQQAGKRFENYFEFACFRQGWAYVPIPQGVKWVPGPRGVRAQPVKSPFDCIISKQGRAGFLDTKTIAKGNFNHGLLKRHQIDALYKLQLSDQTAGYLIWFRDVDKVVFFDGKTLERSFVMSQSLTHQAGLDLGGIEDFNIEVMFKGLLVGVIPGQEGRPCPETSKAQSSRF